MKMYVKPSIEVIELQLTENIAAVPTTVYKGSKKADILASGKDAGELKLKQDTTGLLRDTIKDYQISF